MLYEFALDPGVLNNWLSVRYFLENFGVPKGRLISRFPSKWKKMVYDACAYCNDIEKKRIEEKLATADNKMLRSERPYNSELPWLDNAENQHAAKNFHAIISNTNPKRIADILIADELDETVPLWNIPREYCVQRRADDLSNYARPLIQTASEILFIDPHFNPEELRYRITLKNFLRDIKGNSRIKRIEYHLNGDDSKPSKDYFETKCKEKLSSILPDGIEITFIRWKQKTSEETGVVGAETLHPRYILTELGGIRIEHGLDEGEEGETTDISLLDLSVYSQRWKEYQKETTCFDFVDEIRIVGKHT